MSDMLKEVAKVKEDTTSTAKGEGGQTNEAEELPEGSSPFEARSADAAVESEVAEGSSEETEGSSPAPVARKIKIGEREFDSESDAIKYAEELERKTEAAELYNQGVRDALAANTRPAEATPEPEDNFEERFYANPKEALKEVQSRARDEAVSLIRAENKREALWNQFLSENPDIRRKDAERILAENAETIGRMTDTIKAMKALAQKTRAEYEEIRDLGKPRTELLNKQNQGLSPSGGAPKRVTPKENNSAPLSFTEELKRLKRQG